MKTTMNTLLPLEELARAFADQSWAVSAALAVRAARGGRREPSREEGRTMARRIFLRAVPDGDHGEANRLLRRAIPALHEGLRLGGALGGIQPSRRQRRQAGPAPRVPCTGDGARDLAAALTTTFELTALTANVLVAMGSERLDPPPEPGEVLRELAGLVELSLDRALSDAEAAALVPVLTTVTEGVRAGMAS